ncbi:MAG: hypothetical protein Q4A07_11145 [Coriobacteriales bacterium]|nr:hypothetical protein [Coriobacteriales bacterium]
MDICELRRHAAHNREVFDRVLAPYVALKVANVVRSLDHDARNVWFDASGCAWCLFDDPAFIRAGNEATALKEAQGGSFDLQVFWSMGDVVMPHECDAAWVAKRIAEEAKAQLAKQGLHCRRQDRHVEGEHHKGVLVAKTIFGLR